jgi:hypothetical protein
MDVPLLGGQTSGCRDWGLPAGEPRLFGALA